MKIKVRLPKEERTRRYLIAFVSIVAILTFLLTAYKIRYSMSYVESYEINSKTLPNKVLIATQGSEFKDEVTASVIKALETRPIYIKVIDVFALPFQHEEEWSAIVILHTWEYSAPPEDVGNFVKRATDANKLIVVSTSGSGESKLKGVDGISSASKLSEVAETSRWIVSNIERLLNENFDK